jgi:hypothetical protein
MTKIDPPCRKEAKSRPHLKKFAETSRVKSILTVCPVMFQPEELDRTPGMTASLRAEWSRWPRGATKQVFDGNDIAS